MEPKKSTKANVGRNSSLYFAIGLALMLFLTNYAINYKTYDKQEVVIDLLDLDELDEEDIPITEQLQAPPPPPPPPAVPEVIEIVDDEVVVEETVIESTEVDQETEIVEVDEVDVVEGVEEDIDVPFSIIENSPTYPGCEKGTKAAKKRCLSKKITQFIDRKFNNGLAGELGLSGRQRIIVVFKIDKRGDVVDIRSRAPHPALEKEAKRVIGLLPKMKPGSQRGRPVGVQYTLPIVFQIED